MSNNPNKSKITYNSTRPNKNKNDNYFLNATATNCPSPNRNHSTLHLPAKICILCNASKNLNAPQRAYFVYEIYQHTQIYAAQQLRFLLNYDCPKARQFFSAQRRAAKNIRKNVMYVEGTSQIINAIQLYVNLR